jgi:hypothetical protein
VAVIFVQGKKKEELLAEEDEIDKLLESFGKLDTVCNAEKCKTPVSVLGVNCNFCRIRYIFQIGIFQFSSFSKYSDHFGLARNC